MQNLNPSKRPPRTQAPAGARIAHVVVDIPARELDTHFDYLVPADMRDVARRVVRARRLREPAGRRLRAGLRRVDRRTSESNRSARFSAARTSVPKVQRRTLDRAGVRRAALRSRSVVHSSRRYATTGQGRRTRAGRRWMLRRAGVGPGGRSLGRACTTRSADFAAKAERDDAARRARRARRRDPCESRSSPPTSARSTRRCAGSASSESSRSSIGAGCARSAGKRGPLLVRRD